MVIRRDRERQAAVASLKSCGASLAREWRGPSWAEEPLGRLGFRFFDDVFRVKFTDVPSDVVRSQLALLPRFPELEELDMDECPIGDEGLKHIGAMRNLRLLYVSGTGVTDEGLRNLGRLTSLEGLHLGKTDIRGKGLAHLGCVASLRWLFLNSTPIDDAHLPQVVRFKGLKVLDLSYSGITDRGLACLAGLGELECLYLHGLYGKAITERGLESLAALGTLQYVGIRNADLSGAFRQRFQKLRPDIQLGRSTYTGIIGKDSEVIDVQ